MLRNGVVTKLLLISMAILMISATDFPGQIQRSTAQDIGEDDTPTTTYYSVHLPVVLHIHPMISSLAVETHLTIERNSPVTSRLVELNTGWVRLSGRISWRELQPNEGDPINWSLLADTENELRILQELGRKPIIVLNDSPYWALDPVKARDKNGDLTSCGPIADDKLDAFANFVSQMVAHFRSPEFNVHDWELGNEPDVDPVIVPRNSIYGCWGDIADKYYGVNIMGRC
jgi:hypothetical protein